jgi:hypothetical protein
MNAASFAGTSAAMQASAATLGWLPASVMTTPP